MNFFSKAKEGFKKNPIDSICDWMPFATTIVSTIIAIIAYIVFIACGGYGPQLMVLKGFKLLDLRFVKGSVGIMYASGTMLIVSLMLVAEVVFCILKMIKSFGGVRGVLLSVFGIITIVLLAMDFLFFKLLSDGARAKLSAVLGADVVAVGRFFTLFSVILFVVWIFVFISANNAEAIASLLVGTFISFGIIPAILFVLENIINLMIVLIVLVIACVIGAVSYLVTNRIKNNQEK